MPKGLFKKNDDFSVISKTIVDLESGKSINSSQTQLQSSSQASSNKCDVAQESPRTRTSQSVLYSDFVKEELERLLARSKARVAVASDDFSDYDRVRYRNWLSSINGDSGA